MTHKRRFTLIELIAVMGLIGLVVGLAAPAFSRINKGKSVEIAAETVRNALEQAQAQAIGHHRYVGLFIPSGSTKFSTAFGDDTPDFNTTKYNLASFRSAFLWKETSGTDTVYEFSGWVPQSEWTTPMENARVVKIAASDSSLPSPGDSFKSGPTSVTAALTETGAFRKVRQKSGSTSYSGAVIFTPDGGLASTSDLFLIVQGCTLNNTTIQYTGNETNYFVLHVNRMNGKVSYFQK